MAKREEPRYNLSFADDKRNYELRIKKLGAYNYLFCIATPKMHDTGGG
jgi:hypothetical protein